METVEEHKEHLMSLIANIKSGLFHSRYADCHTYDKVSDLLDIVANIIDDELKESEEM